LEQSTSAAEQAPRGHSFHHLARRLREDEQQAILAVALSSIFVNPRPVSRLVVGTTAAGAALMSDDLESRGPKDRTHINLSNEYEVRYWTKVLGITKEELTVVVYKVGNSVEAVRRELGVIE
jgi:hypothetical protein